MAVYTRSFALRSLPAVGTYVVFQAPADGTIVIRDMTAFLASATAGALRVFVNSGNESVTLWRVELSAGVTSHHWEGRQVVPQGATVHAAIASAPVQLMITGYDLGGAELVPRG